MIQNQNSQKFFKKALMTVTPLVLFFSSPTFAEVESSLVLCKNKKIVRTLRVEMGEDQKCRAIYTKQGVDETIGSGMNPTSCVEYITNVRKNLEEAAWSCREVKEARISAVNTTSIAE